MFFFVCVLTFVSSPSDALIVLRLTTEPCVGKVPLRHSLGALFLQSIGALFEEIVPVLEFEAEESRAYSQRRAASFIPSPSAFFLPTTIDRPLLRKPKE
jgi:hypothetical protein